MHPTPFLFLLIFNTFYQILTATGEIFQKPPHFPTSMTLELTTFECWSGEVKVDNVWTAEPRSVDDVVDAANWAKKYGYQIRASGFMHNWTPLTVPPPPTTTTTSMMEDDKNPPKLILLKTAKYLTKKKVISNDYGNSSVWAQPGITMADLTEYLEWHKLGFYAIPAIGEITLGGVLAIGGHGTGAGARGEVKQPGHTFGTIGNLVMEFTAVVYDAQVGRYILKTFQRSDSHASAFLTNLGLTFLTNVTLRVGPLQHLQCQSRTNILAEKLFAPPLPYGLFNNSIENNGQHNNGKWPIESISDFMDRTGRIEITFFPFTRKPWLKTWALANYKPPTSRHVREPCNYPFSCRLKSTLAAKIGRRGISTQLSKSIAFGQVMLSTISRSLRVTKTEDIWGPSRNVLTIVTKSTLRMTANGYAILTSRPDTQRVLHESHKFYTNLIMEYANRRLFPMNGPFEVRITGVDLTEDVRISNSRSPLLSPAHPEQNRPEWDTVVWLNCITNHETPSANSFMADFENFLLKTFDGRWATVRVEWSKGAGYTGEQGPWRNATFLHKILPKSFQGFRAAVEILKQYDPFRVFTNDFLNTFI